MAQVDGNGHETAYPRGDELPPSFDPRGAFAWTLRSAEIARREREGIQRPDGSKRRGASTPTSLASA